MVATWLAGEGVYPSSTSQPQNEPFARTGASSFYRCLGPLLPKHLGGKGYHIATPHHDKSQIGTNKYDAKDAIRGIWRGYTTSIAVAMW